MLKILLKILSDPSYRRAIRLLHLIKGFHKIQGWLSPIEAAHLFYFAKKCSPQSIVVEIGSWKGKSTFCLAKGLNSGQIFAIDPFDSSGEEESNRVYKKFNKGKNLLRQFERNMENYGLHTKVTPLKGYSKNFVNFFHNIDFLFIDGDHSIEGCLFDYENYSNKIPKGGLIAFHDFYPHRKFLGPTWVVENKVIPSNEYQLLGTFDSLWVGRKK